MSQPVVPADRNRSTYLHPIYGLDGEVLTDDFPKDHYHHRGLFHTEPIIELPRGGRLAQFDKWLSRPTP